MNSLLYTLKCLTCHLHRKEESKQMRLKNVVALTWQLVLNTLNYFIHVSPKEIHTTLCQLKVVRYMDLII
jgi:hypothetical protein